MDTKQIDFRKSLGVTTATIPAKAQLIISAVCIALFVSVSDANQTHAQALNNSEITAGPNRFLKHKSKSDKALGWNPLTCHGSPSFPNEEKWSITKANIDKFLQMDTATIAGLYGCHDCDYRKLEIDLDDKLTLKLIKHSGGTHFSIEPTTKRSYIEFSSFNDGDHFGILTEPAGAVWTGAKRKDEKEYWEIINTNLDKFVGMNWEEVLAVLGPERESSKERNYIRYRVGDASLTFNLRDGKVYKIKFQPDTYIPGT